MPNKASSSRNKELKYEMSICYPDEPLAESVVYRDIFQKGFERGFRRGLLKGVKRMIERQFGALPPKTRQQIEQLALEPLEDLCLALLDFQTKADLTCWLKQHATAPPTPN